MTASAFDDQRVAACRDAQRMFEFLAADLPDDGFVRGGDETGRPATDAAATLLATDAAATLLSKALGRLRHCIHLRKANGPVPAVGRLYAGRLDCFRCCRTVRNQRVGCHWCGGEAEDGAKGIQVRVDAFVLVGRACSACELLITGQG